VRLLVLGHLEGVFDWDEKNRGIKGFDESVIQEMSAMGAERFAAFLNANEDVIFERTAHGHYSGLEEHVLDDFFAILEVLEKIERETGKRILVVLALYDFMLGDGKTAEGPFLAYSVGEHPEIVTDTLTKTKANALLWKIVKTLSRDDRFYRYVAGVEVMNEPANASALATRENFNDLLNFVGENLYLLKDAAGPSVPVTVGFRSWPGDLRYWAPFARGIDILMPHYWESLESYNIDKPGLWSLDTPAENLWEYLGTTAQGRLTGIGEISPGADIKKNLLRAERSGYDFALVWSYSGHDAHDAKVVLEDISEYQRGSKKLSEIKKISPALFKQAVTYLLKAMYAFDGNDDIALKSPGHDGKFREYLAGILDKSGNTDLKNTVREIIDICDLKNIELDYRSMQSLIL